jgi:hypothetical protein
VGLGFTERTSCSRSRRGASSGLSRTPPRATPRSGR